MPRLRATAAGGGDGRGRMVASVLRHHLLDAAVLGGTLLTLLWFAPDLTFYLESPDHGSHLSMARELTLGRFPFVDVFYHYGPLDVFTIALGLWATGSLLGQTVICTLGYGMAL